LPDAPLSAFIATLPRSNSNDPTTNTFDWAAIIEALSKAPLWIALAIIGVGLIAFGQMLDGYRFADGGFIRPAVSTPMTGAPPMATDEADSDEE